MLRSNRFRPLAAFLAVAVLLALASPVVLADRKEELKAAFAARRPALDAAKSAGKIGENFHGYIEAVHSDVLKDPQIKDLIDKENADRAETYRRIAAQTPPATPEDVAARGAAKHFERARPGEYLKHADGQWRKKG